jgi:hypothetical protein
MRRCVTLFGVVLLAGCGGGDSTGPSAPKGIALLRADPPVGATITLEPCPPGSTDCQEGESLTAPVSLSFSVVSDKDYGGFSGVVFGVTWLAGGKQCGDAGVDLGTLKANQPRTVTIDSIRWPYFDNCPLPTTATEIRASVSDQGGFGLLPDTLFGNTIAGGYAFVGSTPSGSRYPVCGSGDHTECRSGLPTGFCKNDKPTCSNSLSAACGSDGGLVCVFCPGPLCP